MTARAAALISRPVRRDLTPAEIVGIAAAQFGLAGCDLAAPRLERFAVIRRIAVHAARRHCPGADAAEIGVLVGLTRTAAIVADHAITGLRRRDTRLDRVIRRLEMQIEMVAACREGPA